MSLLLQTLGYTFLKQSKSGYITMSYSPLRALNISVTVRSMRSHDIRIAADIFYHPSLHIEYLLIPARPFLDDCPRGINFAQTGIFR
jgi:hypothetical protein